MDILDDMGVSKLSAKVFFKSELLHVLINLPGGLSESELRNINSRFIKFIIIVSLYLAIASLYHNSEEKKVRIARRKL